jgi:uncharacterized protein YecE (DUF72 family)
MQRVAPPDVARHPRIGTAGWSIGREARPFFPAEGSSLERYAQLFSATEINSSFHRPHRLATWERWRDSVPAGFRFAVKLPKTISHERKLVDCGGLVDGFLAQAEILGDKLAVLLLQLPPKLAFDPDVAAPFLAGLATRSRARIAVEPRHPGWFGKESEALLAELGIARVAADPAICVAAAVPGGDRRLQYWRLHGSPVKYRSSYGDRLADYADALTVAAEEGAETWCIFDNTASSAAVMDALALRDLT